MIGDAITCLLYALAVAALTQPTMPRLFAAVLFMAVVLLHEVLLSGLTGLQYYGSAALFDLLIIALTGGVRPVTALVLRLHMVCIASILINLMGWVLWFFYYPPLAYDAAFACLYAWTLLVFTMREGANVGGFTLGSWATRFRFDRPTRPNYSNQHGGKI